MIQVAWRVCLLPCFLASLIIYAYGLVDCTSALHDTSYFANKCNNKWKNIKQFVKPTQPQVGYAWIQYKLENDFSFQSSAQEVFDAELVPAVLGPGPALYVVDDHHTLCALDYSGYEDVSVTFVILCDMRDMQLDQFWSALQKQNLAYLVARPVNDSKALPEAIPYTELPSAFAFTLHEKCMSDDAWRSLAGFSRKVQSVTSSCKDEYCERCMFRGCSDGYQPSGPGVAFFEFRWSYFMNDASYHQPAYWPSKEQFASFLQRYASLRKQPADLATVDTTAWLAAAEYVVPLCRGQQAAAYRLSTTLFPDSAGNASTLPGYVQGADVTLPEDPHCDPPVCLL